MKDKQIRNVSVCIGGVATNVHISQVRDHGFDTQRHKYSEIYFPRYYSSKVDLKNTSSQLTTTLMMRLPPAYEKSLSVQTTRHQNSTPANLDNKGERPCDPANRIFLENRYYSSLITTVKNEKLLTMSSPNVFNETIIKQ
ncbi:hypothetical protein ACTXT7_005313 [Hymenolepis weldensis]